MRFIIALTCRRRCRLVRCAAGEAPLPPRGARSTRPRAASTSSFQQCLEGANSTNAVCEPSNYPEIRSALRASAVRPSAKLSNDWGDSKARRRPHGSPGRFIFKQRTDLARGERLDLQLRRQVVELLHEQRPATRRRSWCGPRGGGGGPRPACGSRRRRATAWRRSQVVRWRSIFGGEHLRRQEALDVDRRP